MLFGQHCPGPTVGVKRPYGSSTTWSDDRTPIRNREVYVMKLRMIYPIKHVINLSSIKSNHADEYIHEYSRIYMIKFFNLENRNQIIRLG